MVLPKQHGIDPSRLGRIADIGIHVVLLFSLCCCTRIHSNSTNSIAERQKTGTANREPTDHPNDPTSPEMSKTVVGKVWKRFIKDGRYRLANENDFRIPDWAVKQDHLDRKDIEVPFILSSFGFAAIVVDTTRDYAEGFGLIILSTDEGNEDGANEKNVIHWFCRNKDLSRTVLGGAPGSAGLYTTEYSEDGSSVLCRIGFDDHNRQYVCKTRVARNPPKGG
jgi:hypothetical protein